jgi:hypothetical protein
MVIPWDGFALAKLVAIAEPKAEAKFIQFNSFLLRFRTEIPYQSNNRPINRTSKQKKQASALCSGGRGCHFERNYTVNDGDPSSHHPSSPRDQNGSGCDTRGPGWTEPSLGARTRNDHRAPLSSDLDDV